jgi:hypothetical protein
MEIFPLIRPPKTEVSVFATRKDPPVCKPVSPTSKEVEETGLQCENETPISPTTFAPRRSNKKRFEFD